MSHAKCVVCLFRIVFETVKLISCTKGSEKCLKVVVALVQIGMRTVLVGLALVVAVTIPCFGPLSSLVGAVLCCTISAFLPCVLYMKVSATCLLRGPSCFQCVCCRLSVLNDDSFLWFFVVAGTMAKAFEVHHNNVYSNLCLCDRWSCGRFVSLWMISLYCCSSRI